MSESNYVSVKIKRDTLQKMKVISTLDGFTTVASFLEWVVNKGYEVTLKNKGRKVSLPQ